MEWRIDQIWDKTHRSLPPEYVLAAILWDKVIYNENHLARIKYYEFNCYMQYTHEDDDDGFSIDCKYLDVERSFFLPCPDPKSVLNVAGEILDWLAVVYPIFSPAIAIKKKDKKKTKRKSRR